MTKHPENATGDLAADLAVLRQEIARLTETMSTLVQHQTKDAGHRVSQAVDDAQDTIAGAAADVQKRVRAAGGEIEACIERNPMTAALIAFGLGMFIGIMTRSRG